MLTPETMLRAYAAGIFPMAEDAESLELHWFDPDPRAIIPLNAFHIPRRLSRTLRQVPYQIRIDTDFATVLRRCGPDRPEGGATWMNRAIADACLALHDLGYAHSVEAWREGTLVGGVYGIALGGAFFAESMFSSETGASKIALVHLVRLLREGGFTLLDVQFVNDHLKQFGVIEITRASYKQRLAKALTQTSTFNGTLGG